RTSRGSPTSSTPRTSPRTTGTSAGTRGTTGCEARPAGGQAHRAAFRRSRRAGADHAGAPGREARARRVRARAGAARHAPARRPRPVAAPARRAHDLGAPPGAAHARVDVAALRRARGAAVVAVPRARVAVLCRGGRL